MAARKKARNTGYEKARGGIIKRARAKGLKPSEADVRATYARNLERGKSASHASARGQAMRRSKGPVPVPGDKVPGIVSPPKPPPVTTPVQPRGADVIVRPPIKVAPTPPGRKAPAPKPPTPVGRKVPAPKPPIATTPGTNPGQLNARFKTVKPPKPKS